VASAISSLEGEGRALILPGDAAWASAAGLRRLISYCSSRLASPLTSGGYVASAFICGPLGLLRRASELMCAKASAGGTARMTDLVRASLLGGQALGLTH
jgi:molybdopterin-guanine dinucleotide biosynthesis protein A